MFMRIAVLVVAGLGATVASALAQPRPTIDVAALQSQCQTSAQQPLSTLAPTIADIAGEQATRFREAMRQGRVDERGNAIIVPPQAPQSMDSIDLSAAPAWRWIYNYYAYPGLDANLGYEYFRTNPVRSTPFTAADFMARLEEALPGQQNEESRALFAAPLQHLAVRDTAWSAAFISSVMKQANLTNAQFPRALGHWVYINDAIRRGSAGASDSAFVGCNPDWVRPRVGDLVCVYREDGPRSFDSVVGRINNATTPDRAGYTSHCDVVVETHFEGDHPNVVAIGGNVGNTVRRRSLALTLSPTGARMNEQIATLIVR